MHIIMLFQHLKKFSSLGALLIVKGWEVLRNVADFTGDDTPPIRLQPSGDGGGNIRAVCCSAFPNFPIS
jgi:hypothetical protein